MRANPQTLPRPVFILIAVTVAIGAVVAAALLRSGDIHATHVSPKFLSGASNQGKTCADLEGADQTWSEFKLAGDDLSNGAHTDGTLSVTIANLTGDTFNWTSNIGVDAVIVKGGNAGSHLYRYDPPAESTGDTGLGVPDPGNNGISHIAFCYDVGPPAPTPTPTATPPPGATPTATAEAGATPSPTAEVLGEVRGPTTLPPTGQAPSSDGISDLSLLLVLGGLAFLTGAGAMVAVAARRRR